MFNTISLFIVPVLMIVVLSTLLVTERWANRSLGLGMLGVFGVLFGGPSAIVMLGAHAEEPAAASALAASTTVEPVAALAPAGEADRATAVEAPEVAITEPAEASVLRTDIDGPAIKVRADEAEIADAGSSSASSELPTWVLNGKQLEGDVHTIVVSSGHHLRPRERDVKMREELKRETDEYIAWHIGHSAAPTVINFDQGHIQRHLKSPEHNYQGMRDFGPPLGPMHESYAMLKFDQRFRAMLDRRWEDAVAKTRLLYTGLVGGAILALLGVISTYFRLDNATRGFYTGRLQFVAVTAILVLITVGVLAARWIPWM